MKERIMEMHEHKECEHEIKYCKICDVCYCEKCNKQWSTYKVFYNQPSTTWIGDRTYPNISFHSHE